MHSMLAGLHVFPEIYILPIHGLTVPNIFCMLFGCHNFLWQRSPFAFLGSTVHHLLYPPVPCHHTQRLLITMLAFTHAFASFCGHTVCLTELLPPILSFFTLHTPLMFRVPLCSSGMCPCMTQHFQQPRFTSILLSIITVHMQSTGPCVSHHGRCRNIYTIHRACLTSLVILISHLSSDKLANSSCFIFR